MRLQHLLAVIGVAITSAHSDAPPQDLALRMLTSINERGQSTLGTASTGYIELGLFWQALAVVTELRPHTSPNDSLRPILDESLASTIPDFPNVTEDAELPLDRFSLGADMVAWSLYSRNATTIDEYLPTITSLNESLALQPRNANGGLWYYNNVNNITAYQNLSYLDGMYSFPPFVTIQSLLNDSCSDAQIALKAALDQVQILYEICVQPSGLLVHGYDALKAHKWANSTSGASPTVWGRSLAWYSLGILNTLEISKSVAGLRNSEAYATLLDLFKDIMAAQVQAAERSQTFVGVPGVWQVADRPGDVGNFVEASSSFMTVYTLLRGARLHLLDGKCLTAGADKNTSARSSVRSIATEMYHSVSEQYLITYANGSLSLNGTSSVASLSPQNVSYEYYVSRPTQIDSLIGTSAFVLASYEVGRMRDH